MRTTLALIAITMVLAGCASSPAPSSGATPSSSTSVASSTPVSSTPASSTPVSSTPAATGSRVSIVNFAFGPKELRVPVGTNVTFSNDAGGTPHTATADDGAWDSGTLQDGQTFGHAFAQAGTFAYHCAIHPSMKGTIVVS